VLNKIVRFGITIGALWLIVQFGSVLRGNGGDNRNVSPAYAANAASTYRLFLPLVVRSPVSPSVFGMGIAQISTASGLNQLIKDNVQWVRSNNILSWASVEPLEGQRNWTAEAGLEKELLNASANGIQVILVVRQTPSWAQAISGYTCGPIVQEKFGAFANFMRDAVARYSVPPYNVKYWEIWNEPDIAPSLASPTSDWGCWGNQNDPYYGGGYYGSMLQSIYPQMKAVDPQSSVLVGGLVLDCDPNNPPTGKSCVSSKFLQGILANNGGAYFDGVSFHAYDYYGGALGQYSNANWSSAWNTTGPVSLAKATFLKNTLSSLASSKFLIDTEAGILCDTCANNSTFEATKAYYLAEDYAGAIAQGLRAHLWYDLTGWRNSGLLNPNLTPLPAETAFHFARNELRNGTFEGNVSVTDVNTPGVKGYKINRGDLHVWILWSLDGGTHTLSMTNSPLAAWDALGNPLKPSTSMTLDLKLIYLEWQ